MPMAAASVDIVLAHQTRPRYLPVFQPHRTAAASAEHQLFTSGSSVARSWLL